MGRLTRDPVLNDNIDTQSKFARYTIAVDRRYAKRDDPKAQTADFINCIVFGKGAEFASQYLRQGTKMVVVGRLQTGSYTNKDGQKVYTTDVVVEEQEFAESKREGASAPAQSSGSATVQTATTAIKPDADGFVNIPDGIADEELPFN